MLVLKRHSYIRKTVFLNRNNRQNVFKEYGTDIYPLSRCHEPYIFSLIYSTATGFRGGVDFYQANSYDEN